MGGDRNIPNVRAHRQTISIHAPRVGGDTDKLGQNVLTAISIHAPRVGGDGERVKV